MVYVELVVNVMGDFNVWICLDELDILWLVESLVCLGSCVKVWVLLEEVCLGYEMW